MAYPMGEAKPEPLRVDFDCRLKLEFPGSKITSDAGLLAYRELDDVLGLTDLGGAALSDLRRGKNTRHLLTGLLRQSVYGRLAGYEDVNDAERPSLDPAMRAIVDCKGLDRRAASTSQMGRFETEWLATEWLATEENFAVLNYLPGAWIDRVHDRKIPKIIILDMDSSVSPTHGGQEGSAYNGHFGCSCYHPLFVFNQFGDLERCALRAGSVHSAHGWRDVLEHVVARYRDRRLRRYFRGDAAFASPDLYEFLEAEGYKYAIRLKANAVLQESIVHLLTRPVGRPPNHVRRFHASFSYQAGSWSSKRRVVAKIEWHPGQLFPRVGFIVTNLSRPAERVTKFTTAGAQRSSTSRKARTVMSQLPQQRGASSAARLGLQPGQLHANIGFAEGGRALVVDHAAGEAGEDRREGGQSRAVRHLPTSGGRRPKSPVR